jgi:hypothetical protein
MSEDSFVYCNIRIKQEQLPYSYGNGNYALRQKKSEEIQKKFRDDMFRVLNSVVESGGAFCLDKHILDSEWRLFVQNHTIRIPKDAVTAIKNLPQIETLTVSSSPPSYSY